VSSTKFSNRHTPVEVGGEAEDSGVDNVTAGPIGRVAGHRNDEQTPSRVHR
jgi:hypothetical protein